MANIHKITIALTNDLASTVREAVRGGEYASASEVIRDALRDWNVKRSAQREQIEQIRRAWQTGIESGSAGPLDMTTIKRTARERAAR
jgi:antitoxin ParD1/3/4